jgi:hypothetical protein
VDYDCGRLGEHLGVFSGIVVTGDQISELAGVKASDFQEVVRRRAGRCERDLRPKPKFRHQRNLLGNASDNVGSSHDRHAQIGRDRQQVPEPFPTLKSAFPPLCIVVGSWIDCRAKSGCPGSALSGQGREIRLIEAVTVLDRVDPGGDQLFHEGGGCVNGHTHSGIVHGFNKPPDTGDPVGRQVLLQPLISASEYCAVIPPSRKPSAGSKTPCTRQDVIEPTV